MCKLVALLTFASFVLIALSTWTGLLIGIDEGVARSLVPAGLDAAFPWVATLWSPEISLAVGAVSAAVMWRLGAGRWATATTAFLLLVPVEVALKLSLARPAMPVHLKPWPAYAVVNFASSDSVVNGSPIRSSFLCLLWAIVLWRLGGKGARAIALVAITIDVASSVVRVWGHYHWLSGEMAGQLLGASLAILVGVPVARRVEKAMSLRSARLGRSRPRQPAPEI